MYKTIINAKIVTPGEIIEGSINIDGSGKIVEVGSDISSSENVYDASGTLKKKITYTYNNKKLKETKVTTDPDGTVKSVKKYTYEFY